MGNGVFTKFWVMLFLLKRDIDLADCTVDPNKITQLAWRPLMQVMAEWVAPIQPIHICRGQGRTSAII